MTNSHVVTKVATSLAQEKSPLSVNLSMRASVPSHVLYRELDGEAVLLNLIAERYFGLDEVGTRMWGLVCNSESIEAAYEQLLHEYDVEPATLRRDLEELVELLLDHGLIELSG